MSAFCQLELYGPLIFQMTNVKAQYPECKLKPQYLKCTSPFNGKSNITITNTFLNKNIKY